MWHQGVRVPWDYLKVLAEHGVGAAGHGAGHVYGSMRSGKGAGNELKEHLLTMGIDID